MPGFPLPGLPFHCQPQTAPAWAHCASRNANYSFLAGCSTLPGPHPSSDPAVHGKSALGYGRRGERSHGVLENPTGREERELQPLLPALPGTEWGRTGVTLQDPPQQVLYLLWHHPSSFLLLKSIKQTLRAERAPETAAAQHPRQAPGANTEP